MNRRSFLSAFLSSAAAAIVTPQIVTHGLQLHKQRHLFYPADDYKLVGIETGRIIFRGVNLQSLPKGDCGPLRYVLRDEDGDVLQINYNILESL